MKTYFGQDLKVVGSLPQFGKRIFIPKYLFFIINVITTTSTTTIIIINIGLKP